MRKLILTFIMCLVYSSSFAMNNDLDCMSKNIYFEARNQPVQGQLAVAYVVLNRVKSKRYPNSICAVVKQHKQFSWYSDGLSDRPRDIRAWKIAKFLAKTVIVKTTGDNTKGAIYYHTIAIQPYWSFKKKISAIIGDHVFYID